MDLWRLELVSPDPADRALAGYVLDDIGVEVGWTDRPDRDGAVVAGLDLGFRLDPPAVAAALRDAGVDVARLRRLPLADVADDLGDRRIA